MDKIFYLDWNDEGFLVFPFQDPFDTVQQECRDYDEDYQACHKN